jgi:hypothetical protein
MVPEKHLNMLLSFIGGSRDWYVLSDLLLLELFELLTFLLLVGVCVLLRGVLMESFETIGIFLTHF